ncbi:sigma-E factor negative regulatory protein [Marilutibacter maris]|nr:sigma-E factor negative regulatory protein [Lysobacter maris]
MTPGGEDREALSALFDGELESDAARFAQRRLLHDGQWRDACGRWQLAGDVLRRRADAVAPIRFADRVARALADEAAAGQAVASSAAPASRRSRRRWVPGAALAASVAVAALFVARPLSNPDAPDAQPAAPSQVAAAVPATVDDTGDGVESSAAAGAAVAAAAVAVAEVPRRSGERPSRGQSQRAAVRATRREAPATTALANETATAMSAPAYAAAGELDGRAPARDPFQPGGGADDGAAKPWPRAVLPGYGAPSGYTVGYGEPIPVTPSFYPFEPRLPEEQDAAPSVESPPGG